MPKDDRLENEEDKLDINDDVPATFTTPMMKQYMEVKHEYQDCLLLFRLGDFYELFLEDAHIGAKVLQIALTARPRGRDGSIPMAGVPYHAADRYISKLVNAGYKVAICDQVSEPNAKGIVDRKVTRIVTPGTQLDEQTLPEKQNNHIVALAIEGDVTGISIADVSTGELKTTEIDLSIPKKMPGKSVSQKIASVDPPFDEKHYHELIQELLRLSPAECIVSEALDNRVRLYIAKVTGVKVTMYKDFIEKPHDAKKYIMHYFKVATVEQFGIHKKNAALMATASLLSYVEYTQKRQSKHIHGVRLYTPLEYMSIDESTVRNLELFEGIRNREKKGTLLSSIDYTNSAMGGRMLAEWLRRPLQQKNRIDARLDVVECIHNNTLLRNSIRDIIKDVYDVERLVAKLSCGIGNAADLVNLKASLYNFLRLRDILQDANEKKIFRDIIKQISPELKKIADTISLTIVDEPPIDLKHGGLIKRGVNNKLDEFQEIIANGQDWLAKLEQAEREKTGITTLKIRFNKVFGYYIEISQSYRDKVPDTYIRKQTLVNAERFITQELKEYEDKILHAEEKMSDMEYTIFLECVERVLENIESIQQSAQAVGELDCLTSFAQLAHQNDYVRPRFVQKNSINIVDGRHPVVEQLMDDVRFVPNNVELDTDEMQVHLITGPNMAGKSVYMRQIALIVLLAHIGSFVPARSASMSIVDRIFVRSGASDVITLGQSTFMVEMVETAYILNHATSKSLVILDEIGRGTSTFDGVSIAWAVAEYLVTRDKIRPKTLFATHYHELQELEAQFPGRVKNYHMAVEEYKGNLVFLHHVVPGGASHSYGIAVAQLAGVPTDVVENARKKLKLLESGNV